MVKIYYFISACLLLFSCNNNNTQVSSSDDIRDTISSIKRDTIVEKDTIAPIQVPKEETDEATKMILEFYDKYIRQQNKMPCLDNKEFCEEELREIEREFLLSRPKNGLQLFCQFNLCFSFFKLSIVYKNSFTTSV